MNELFELIDRFVGDVAVFRGLTFEFGHGYMVIDIIRKCDVMPMYIVDFYPHSEDESPVTFAAKGEEELKDQIEHFVLY